jgi:hypothetical protein
MRTVMKIIPLMTKMIMALNMDQAMAEKTMMTMEMMDTIKSKTLKNFLFTNRFKSNKIISSL